MDEVVANCDLILVVSLIQIFIEHLYEGLLGVELSLIVLGVDVDLVAQFFCLGDTHDLAPVGQQFFLVKVDYLVLALDLRSKNVLLHLRQLLQLVELFLRLGDLPNLDVLFGRKPAWPGAAPLEGLTEESHLK